MYFKSFAEVCIASRVNSKKIYVNEQMRRFSCFFQQWNQPAINNFLIF